VDDTIEAMWRLMDADVEGPLNIGNPIEHTVLELAQLVLELTKSRSRIEHRALPADDPHRRCPDLSRVQRHLQWTPRVSLADGLRETIAYFENELVTS
jgi:UDP-glucuronate decarboxylase